ncbi:DUF3231 family protein [Bacillus coreaensis]
MTHKNNHLPSSELANLWKVYMIENLLIPYKLPMINTCQDEKIKSILLFALDISKKATEKIRKVYQLESHPLPTGFTKEDVNTEAPALFTDNFYLLYIHEMGKLGFRLIPQAVESTESKDVLDILYSIITDYKVLYERTSQLLFEKKLFPQSPKLPIPKATDIINDQSYLTGWLGSKRPLNAEEILKIHSTAHRNALSKALLTGFSKVVKDPDVKKYIERGIKNTNQILGEIQQLLINENLNLTTTYDEEVLNSTISPYSDKLILVHVAQMGAGSIGIYGSDLASVFRRDIGMKYIKFISEALLYSEDGMNLLIKKGWLEEPPKNEY